jgi:hypothetical protein
MPEGNSIQKPRLVFILNPQKETGSLQSVLRQGAQEWKGKGDGMSIETELTQSRIIVGRKPCGNPECPNEIPFYNDVSFQHSLKYRPKSLCPRCKGLQAVKTRREREAATGQEFKLSPATVSP